MTNPLPDTDAGLIDWLKRCASAIYITVHRDVADEISPRLREAASALSSKAEEIEKLKWMHDSVVGVSRDTMEKLIATEASLNRMREALEACANDSYFCDFAHEYLPTFTALQAQAALKDSVKPQSHQSDATSAPETELSARAQETP